MLLQLLFLQPEPQAWVRGHARALPLLGYDHAFTFEFEIRPLDCDDADLEVYGKLADRRYGLAFRPVSDSNAALDLLHDLQVDRTLVGLGDQKTTTHVCVYTKYTQ